MVNSVIFSIIINPPADRYREQQRNILSGSGVFEPATLAPGMLAKIEKARLEC